MPLLKRTRLVGLFYLENNLASGVFTPARMALLELLATEAAISLTNARLYRDLQEREARMRRLVDSNIIGVIMWGAEGRILDANEAFLHIVGYDHEDLISGRVRWRDLSPPEWHERDTQRLAEIKEAGASQPLERELIRKDGTRVPTLVASARFDGAPDEGVSFVLDLTERKKVENDLQAATNNLTRFLDSFPGLVAILDVTGRVEYFSQQFLNYCGGTLDDLRDWTLNDIVHPDDLSRAIETVTRNISNGTAFAIDHRLRRADGVYRWFTARSHPVRDADGHITGWYSLLTDIDELKSAEQAIRQSERELSLIVDSIPGMICVLSGAGVLEFMNRQGLEYFGLTIEDMARWANGSITHPDDLQYGIEQFTRFIAAGRALGLGDPWQAL
jgi:PAS domain S-box-containing protein